MTELRYIFAVVLPYAGLLPFLLGIVWRVVRWAMAPVPFRIPTTCGQQKSLAWIKNAWLESPHSTAGAVARVASEVLLFRSLLRDERTERQGMRLASAPAPWLWLGALAFHWALLAVVLRHLRFFLEPVPQALVWLQGLDGFFQAGTPVVYLSDVLLLGALCFLLARRVALAQMRYLSLPADYFALGLLVALAGSGAWLRYFGRIDIADVKRYVLSLTTFAPAPPAAAGAMFYAHIALVSLLLAYFPFSKLMHMGGIFLSPTRNLANNSRAKRHINPWNPAVEVHTYEQWEDEFRAKMKAAGLPVERP